MLVFQQYLLFKLVKKKFVNKLRSFEYIKNHPEVIVRYEFQRKGNLLSPYLLCGQAIYHDLNYQGIIQ